ncbi:MFS transporter [Elongatibacter sediminis]|uniref:MFS transporter n=1 Tax=Elongatibacter sediminis TaxID=3119006 RepID=A0AAW9RIS8_9GAMM
MHAVTGARPGVFYGWWNVAASFAGLSLSYAMFTVFSFGTYVGPLQAEFGWDRGPMSLALTIANATVVLASPLLGLLIDRLGARRVMVVSVALLGLCVLSMRWLTGDIRHYYLMHILLPLLGAGTLPLSYSRIIVAWFEKRRGLALGIALSGFGVGAALVPAFAQWMIDQAGWRESYLIFGGLILLVSLPLTAFVLRDRPSDMGELPDGRRPLQEPNPAAQAAVAAGAAPEAEVLAGMSLGEAIRTRPFWFLIVSIALIGIGITSILAHLVPMLIGRGVAPATAALAMSLLGLGLIFGRILSGWLMDRFFAPYVAAGFQLGMVCGLVLLALDFSGPLAFMAGLSVGLATGSEISEISYLVSRYFGLKAFGLINGILFASFQLGSGIGAYAMGAWYDHAGNYLDALWVVTGLVVISTILIATLGPYPRQASRPAV